jgi:UMF1 family MFS transporter
MNPSSRRVKSGWALFDVANSAFVTVVVTALGGAYLSAAADGVEVFGRALEGATLYSGALVVAVVLQLLVLPAAGAVAQSPRGKRVLVSAATTTGALATLALGALPTEHWALGLLALVLAQASFGAAMVGYNSMLADVATPEERDALSARGFAAGYVGGAVLLAAALGALTLLGASGSVVRVSIMAAGAWWLVLGLLSMRLVRPATREDSSTPLGTRVRASLSDIKRTFTELGELKRTRRFLLGYVLFNNAVQAVVALSGVFVTFELFTSQGRPASEATGFLLALVLVIQLVAALGALGFERLGKRIGAHRALVTSLVGWLAVLAWAAMGVSSEAKAWALGVAIALVLGGSQGLARSQFSLMVPRSRQSSFFALYALSERGTTWLGSAVFAVALEVTGSYSLAIGALGILLLAGLLVVRGVDTSAARADAEAYEEGTRLELVKV